MKILIVIYLCKIRIPDLTSKDWISYHILIYIYPVWVCIWGRGRGEEREGMIVKWNAVFSLPTMIHRSRFYDVSFNLLIIIQKIIFFFINEHFFKKMKKNLEIFYEKYVKLCITFKSNHWKGEGGKGLEIF